MLEDLRVVGYAKPHADTEIRDPVTGAIASD
jgi:hypothetical protein